MNWPTGSATVALTAGKTIASVTLPAGGALTAGTPAVHVFAISASAVRALADDGR